MVRIIKDTSKERDINVIGGKAQGLFLLKSLESKINKIIYDAKAEIPRFFVVPPLLNLSDNYQKILEATNPLETNTFAVRSSSQLEDNGEHSFDGIFDTMLNVPKDKLVRSICNVRKSWKSEKAEKYAKDVGVELKEDIPVIVQAIAHGFNKGVVYSKFPAVRDITKVIREDLTGQQKYIESFLREKYGNGRYRVSFKPIIVSEIWDEFNHESCNLSEIALLFENEFRYPTIIEFIIGEKEEASVYNLLQARKLTRLSESEKFQMPELQEKGLLCNTYDLNGVGDFTEDAFVVEQSKGTGEIMNDDQLYSFDSQHPGGYVLVTPWLKFYNTYVDDMSPNKKAVVAYSSIGENHDMEIARKKGILYLNVDKSLGFEFRNYFFKYGKEKPSILTGDKVRVVSDGEQGFVFNLSRKLK